MSDTKARSTGPTRSLRSWLFVSHLLVMVVALVGVAVTLALVNQLGLARELGIGRRGDGPLSLLVAVVAAAAAAAVVSWSMTKRLAEPIEGIGAMTRSLAGGRYQARAAGSDTVELDALAADVNHLADQLETTEQRRLQLIGDVAHELRNPLSTIQGSMEALLDGVVEPNDDTYARVGREAARLRRLADDLSTLSSAGELSRLSDQRVDLQALVVDVVAHLRPQSLAKDLQLEVAASALPPVRGDADRLTQVLMNVIGNAIQYTDAGRVDVQANVSGQLVMVDVVDTGRGLAAEDQSRIFERFHRVDQDFADGTGVGLAIAKLIVEAHGGAIAASSDGLGLGTTVTITLPTNPPPV